MDGPLHGSTSLASTYAIFDLYTGKWRISVLVEFSDQPHLYKLYSSKKNPGTKIHVLRK